jgi:hypothetical protein
LTGATASAWKLEVGRKGLLLALGHDLGSGITHRAVIDRADDPGPVGVNARMVDLAAPDDSSQTLTTQ